MEDRRAYPVRLEGRLDPQLSRWLWVEVAAGDPALHRALLSGSPSSYSRSSPSSRSCSPDATHGASSTSTLACCAGPGASVLLVRRAGHGPLPAVHARRGTDYPATLDIAYPERLARPRAREVVAARDPPVHPGRDLLGGAGSAAGRAQDWGGTGGTAAGSSGCSSSS